LLVMGRGGGGSTKKEKCREDNERWCAIDRQER